MSNLIESLKWRYACQEFDRSKIIPQNQFDQIIQGLVLTASSFGAQPWEFIVVRNKDLRAKLVGASYNQDKVKDASHLIVICRPSVIDENFLDGYIANICQVRGQEPSELAGLKAMIMHTINKTDAQKAAWAKNQIYIALGNLLTICADMRIDSCPMEGFVPSKVDEILGLESMGLKSVVLCPLGYRSIDDKYSSIPKVRHDFEKVIKVID
jgi:nitroreductase